MTLGDVVAKARKALAAWDEVEQAYEEGDGEKWTPAWKAWRDSMADLRAALAGLDGKGGSSEART